MVGNNIVLDCNKSLNYICSCIYVANTNNDADKRDFFAKYLLDNNIDKNQIKNSMSKINKSSLPNLNEVITLYNELQNEMTNVVENTATSNDFISYNDCPILCELKRKEEPLISEVPLDEFTNEAQLNFDYEFDGKSRYYPYELPKELLNINFDIMVICGRSGSGKSTLLKEFGEYGFMSNTYDNSKAVISNFKNPYEATHKLSAVGLNSIPVWCRPRNVLSIGEGFRADVALNLNNYTIFDEFTSTIDRNVAKSTCNGIQKYIRKNGLHNIVFCSCHKDYIPYVKPDIVVDLDEEKVFDCRGKSLGESLASQFTNMMATKMSCGASLGSFTI
jgi:energy-coupling factor transporter ATP-binding protein EcfA2